MSSIDVVLSQVFFSLGSISALSWLWIFCAQYIVDLLVIGAFVLLFKEKDRVRRWMFFWRIILMEAIGWGFMHTLFNWIFERTRPFQAIPSLHLLISRPLGSSFPSGHTMFMSALTVVVWQMYPKWGKWFALATVISGFSRVIVGAHWAGDILGGMVIVGVIAIVYFKLLPYKNSQEQREQAEVVSS